MKNKYSIKSIYKYECEDWFLKKHYLRRMPNINKVFGLYDNSNLLQGVCSFGKPISYTLVQGAINGLYQNNFLELNRLVINEGLEKNVLSFFVSGCLNRLPKPLVVVSYADTSQGHHGFIYQATNWIYTGLSAKRPDYKIKGLEHLHTASITDSLGRTDKKNIKQIELLKKKYGKDFYTIARPRKHRYFYFLGNKKEKAHMNENLQYKIEPYPKGDNKRYDASYVPSVQGVLF